MDIPTKIKYIILKYSFFSVLKFKDIRYNITSIYKRYLIKYNNYLVYKYLLASARYLSPLVISSSIYLRLLLLISLLLTIQFLLNLFYKSVGVYIVWKLNSKLYSI